MDVEKIRGRFEVGPPCSVRSSFPFTSAGPEGHFKTDAAYLSAVTPDGTATNTPKLLATPRFLIFFRIFLSSSSPTHRPVSSPIFHSARSFSGAHPAKVLPFAGGQERVLRALSAFFTVARLMTLVFAPDGRRKEKDPSRYFSFSRGRTLL